MKFSADNFQNRPPDTSGSLFYLGYRLSRYALCQDGLIASDRIIHLTAKVKRVLSARSFKVSQRLNREKRVAVGDEKSKVRLVFKHVSSHQNALFFKNIWRVGYIHIATNIVKTGRSQNRHHDYLRPLYKPYFLFDKCQT